MQKRGRKPNQEILVCNNCGKSYGIRKSHAHYSRYCSKNCHSLSKVGKKASKETCEKIRQANVRNGNRPPVYHLKGKNNPNWKGGISKWSLIVRGSENYRNWRLSVFKRDNFECAECGYVGKEIQAHHIYRPFIELINNAVHFMPLLTKYDACMAYTPLWDISNGLTLCKTCHLMYHGKKRRK